MSPPQIGDDDLDELRRLLDDGLACYGRGQTARAIELWRLALVVRPGDPEAQDYLSSAGASESTRDGAIDVAARGPRGSGTRRQLDRPRLLERVKTGDYDGALDMLHRAHRDGHHRASVSRSIKHLRARLSERLLKSVGGMDAVLGRVVNGDEPPRKSDVRLVYDLVDGVASVAEIMQFVPTGQLETLRILSDLMDRGLIEVLGPETSAAGGRDPDPEADGSAKEPEPALTYSRLYSEAVDAYFDGDYAVARAKFERCLEVRPGDARVLHNLERLTSLEKG